MQAQLEQQHVCSLAPSCVGQAQGCLAGSCEHVICSPLFPPKNFSRLLPALTSVYRFPTSPGSADFMPLFGIYAPAALVIFNFDSNSVKLLPFSLSTASCRFSFCRLVSGTPG